MPSGSYSLQSASTQLPGPMQTWSGMILAWPTFTSAQEPELAADMLVYGMAHWMTASSSASDKCSRGCWLSRELVRRGEGLL